MLAGVVVTRSDSRRVEKLVANESVSRGPSTTLRASSRSWFVASVQSAAVYVRKMLSEIDIGTKLTGLPSSVIEEILRLVEGQVHTEVDRQRRLNTKAVTILVLGQFILMLAIALGTFGLSIHHQMITRLGVFFVTIAIGTALGALFLGPRPALNEEALFYEPLLNRLRTGPDELSEQEARTQFQMSMIIHLWKIVQQNREAHDRRAKMLRWGQFALVLSFSCLSWDTLLGS